MGIFDFLKKPVQKTDPALLDQLKKRNLLQYDISGKAIISPEVVKKGPDPIVEKAKKNLAASVKEYQAPYKKALVEQPKMPFEYLSTTEKFERAGDTVKKVGKETKDVAKKGIVTGALSFVDFLGKGAKLAGAIEKKTGISEAMLSQSNPIFKNFSELFKPKTPMQSIAQADPKTRDSIVGDAFIEMGSKLMTFSQQKAKENPQWNIDGYFSNKPGLDGVQENLKKKPVQYLTYLTTSQAPLAIAQIATAWRSVGASIAMYALGSGGQTYDEAKQFGDSEDAALLKGTISGAIQGMLGGVGVRGVTQALGKGKSKLAQGIAQSTDDFIEAFMKSMPKTKAALTEMTTENLENFTANAIATTYDKNRKIFDAKEMFETSLSTLGITGGVFGLHSLVGKEAPVGLSIKDVSKDAKPSVGGKSQAAQALVEEAKNYKSAEEFVNSKNLYHGTPNEIKGGKLTYGMKSGQDSGGLFFTDKPEVANIFTFGKGEVYQATPEIKNSVIDLTKSDGIKKVESYIGKTYKTYDGETVKFTQQDFDLMFPNGKTDFASVSQYPELIQKIVKDNGKKGIAFEEYAGGTTGKTYQILEGDVPVYTKSQLTDIWNQANLDNNVSQKTFEGFTDLSTTILEKLKGRSTVSKEFITNLTNSPDLKQVERDTIRQVLEDEGDTVDVTKFANKVKAELLPLERVSTIKSDEDFMGQAGRYEQIALPDESRGPVYNYSENIYTSPIKTSAGNIHYPNAEGSENYYGHTRVEDMADGGVYGQPGTENTTRRVIEVQSDLYQKGNIDKELDSNDFERLREATNHEKAGNIKTAQRIRDEVKVRQDEVAKLQQYNDPTAHFRMIREEVKKAAEDGKTKLQFPTGETAMKIEGLGESQRFVDVKTNQILGLDMPGFDLAPKIGREVKLQGDNSSWIITDVLGDGKFKAVKKNDIPRSFEYMQNGKTRFESNGGQVYLKDGKYTQEDWLRDNANRGESFDISGKVDTNNPIYKFYEKEVGRYLKNKYKAELVTDEQGVKWWEVNVDTAEAKKPVVAYSKLNEKKDYDITTKQAEKILAELFPNEQDIKFFTDPDLIKNEGAYGLYDRANELITVVIKGEKIQSKTLFHEALHRYIDIYLTPAERKALFAEVAKNHAEDLGGKYGESRFSPEEWLTHYFQEYAVTGKTFGGRIRSFIIDMVARLRSWMGKENKALDLFNDLLKNKNKTRVDQKSPDTSIQKRIADSVESHLKNKSIDPVEFLSLIRRERAFLKQYRETGGLIRAEERIYLDREKRSQINGSVVEGLKNNTVFRKEKSLNDAMGESYLMERNGRFLIPQPSQIQSYIDKGYKKGMEIDSLAHERGFETGLEYLQDQLDRSRVSRMTDPMKVSKENLLKENREYRELVDSINAITETISSDRARLLLEKGKRIEIINRRQRIRELRDYFNLTDSELRKISKKDPRLMGQVEFERFIGEFERKSVEYLERTQAKAELMQLIQDRALKNTDNLRSALKLPKIEDMTIEQMRQFEAALEPYQKNDVFLSERLLETIDNTDLSGLKTFREVKQKMADTLGVKVDELSSVQVGWMDKFLYDTALARKNSFYNFIVDQFSKYELQATKTILEKRSQINALANAARKSRKRTIGDRLVPTDKLAFEYAESTNKPEFAKENKMTPEEIDYANFVVQDLARIRDILIQREALSKSSRFLNENYVTHIQRPFLEAIKDAGIRTAFAEMFNKNQLQEATFKIIDDTGNILAYEKFFPYALQRTGGINPTQNLAKAYMTYIQAFEKKHSLDAVIPEIMAYAKILTPEEMTKRGLVKDPSLENFVKTWLNNKKGRKHKLVIAQGDKLDNIVRSLSLFITLRDLGFNPFAGLASTIGENVTNLAQLRSRLAIGKARKHTQKGKAIVKKYENFVGESPMETIFRDASKHIGEKTIAAAFGMFHRSSHEANKDFLLSSLTKEEYNTGVISDERLAQMRKDMGRYRVVEGAKSIIGSTVEGEVAMKYRSWAVPTLLTTIDNIKKAQRQIRSGQLNTKEIKELVAVTIMTSAIVLLVSNLLDDENDSFFGKLAKRAKQESMSVLSSFDPRLWTNAPRMLSFLNDVSTGLVMLVKLEKYKEKDGLKGVDQLKRTLIPTILNQFLPASDTLKPYSEKSLQKRSDDIFERLEKGEIIKEQAEKEFNSLYNEQQKRKDAQHFVSDMDVYLDDVFARIDAGELTMEEAKSEGKRYEKWLKAQGDKGEISGEQGKKSEQNIIDEVLTYAKAIGSDPVIAFNRIFTGQRIRRVDNDTVIVERMPLEESQEYKKEQKAGNDLILDHTLPLQLGGSNSKGNLKLVPIKEWEKYTPVENYIGQKLRDGDISKKEAQQLIRDFKENKVTFDEIKQQYP